MTKNARKLAVLVICVVAVAFGGTSLVTTNRVCNIMYDRQAFAIHMNTATSNQTTIVLQGISASGPSPQVKPKPYEHLLTVPILPYRSDGSIYKGTLTFTATKPVEVVFGHRIPIDNATLSRLGTLKFGKLFVRDLIKFPGNLTAPSRIIPDYRASISPYFSASLPFVASSVTLRTDGEPFIAAYDVAADIVKPTIIEHLGNATTSTTTNSTVK